MKQPYGFKHNGTEYTLRDSVEIIAVNIAEAIFKKEKGVEEVMQDCKILDSLSTALLATAK